MRFGIWRFAVVPSDAGEKNAMCTSTIPHVHNSPKDNRPNCCQHCIAKCGKKLYRCTSTFPKVLGWNFFKSLSYLQDVVHTHFSADFWTFHNF